MDTYKKIGVDKVTKDIYKMDVPKSLRQKKMFGGLMQKVKNVNKSFARKIQILTVMEQRAKVMGKNEVVKIAKNAKESIRKTRKV